MNFSQNESYWTRRRKIRKQASEIMSECLVESYAVAGVCENDAEALKDDQASRDCDEIRSESDEASQLGCKRKAHFHENLDLCSKRVYEQDGVLESEPENIEYDEQQSCHSAVHSAENVAESSVDVEWETFLSEASQDIQTDTSSDTESDVNEGETDNSIPDESSLAFELGMWATSYSIPLVACSALLSVLRIFHPSLPKDPRTLLKTPRKYNVKAVGEGSYFHFGIVKSLSNSKLLSDYLSLYGGLPQSALGVSLQVNFDGLPIFKNGGKSFWPILGRVSQPVSLDPFMIGLYCGDGKPSNLDEYLNDFVEEMQTLEGGPVTIDFEEGTCSVFVSVSCFVCDAPARAFIKQVKGHSGYYGCDKCTQKGVWDQKTIFPDVDAPLRSQVSFDEMTDAGHHIGVSPLNRLSVDMVAQFPLDYMHLLCLGVMRRLLMFWLKSPVSKGIRLSQSVIRQVSGSISEFKSYIPREFSRKCRCLNEVERWKATEFRQFLLYSGIVALKGRLPRALYKHFLLLFVAVHCLASPDLWQSHADYAHELLCLFVREAADNYGTGILVYNIHSLVHIAADVKRFGPLDSYSAFPFENFLGRLKKLVRKPEFPLQQVVRRMSERNGVLIRNKHESTSPLSNVPQREHCDGPLVLPARPGNCIQYKQVQYNGFFHSVSEGDNCVQIHNQFYLIRNILVLDQAGIHIIVIERFEGVQSFFDYPADSMKLGIVKASRLSGYFETAQISDIQRKYVLLPYTTKYILLPLHHQK